MTIGENAVLELRIEVHISVGNVSGNEIQTQKLYLIFIYVIFVNLEYLNSSQLLGGGAGPRCHLYCC